jgi:hypothetical protein
VKRIKAVVLSAVLAVGIVGVPVAAQAGSALCPSARACIYVDPSWVGLFGTKAGGGVVTNVGVNEVDKASSWENKTSSDGRWYQGNNGSGSCFNMFAGTQTSSIGYPHYDSLNSWGVNGRC